MGLGPNPRKPQRSGRPKAPLRNQRAPAPSDAARTVGEPSPRTNPARRQPGPALSASIQCPRIAWVNAVVRPHPGHGAPVHIKKPQGGRPSWVCVPWPLASGSKQAAMTKTNAQPPARVNHKRRCESCVRSERSRIVIWLAPVWIAVEAAVNPDHAWGGAAGLSDLSLHLPSDRIVVARSRVGIVGVQALDAA
jgi:hypothetical protein